MDSRFLLSLLVVFAVFCSLACAHDKKCISYCGMDTPNGIDCPSGYNCTNWDGCGLSCLRTGKYQPDDCPMVSCMAVNCPLGFERNERGCEGCNCANMDAIRIIEQGHYEGSAPSLSAFVSVSVAVLCTAFSYLF